MRDVVQGSTLRIVGCFAVGMERREISHKWGISYARVQQVTSMTEYGQGAPICRYAKDRLEQFYLWSEYKDAFTEMMETNS